MVNNQLINQIKVSIIIPFYNREEYLEECLDSIINQTLKNIEIICIDDSSTDDSCNIIRKFMDSHSNITLIKQEKAGVGAARNNGIKAAKGDFIAFMDSDDFYFDQNVLKTLYDKAIYYNVKICGGSMSHWHHGERKMELFDQNHHNIFTKEEIVKYVNHQRLEGFTRFIYNRKLILDNKIIFPLYTYFEDPVFFIQAMHIAKEFLSVPIYAYCYRREHKTQMFNKNDIKDTLKATIDVLEIAIPNSYNEIVKYLNKHIKFFRRYFYVLCYQNENDVISHLRQMETLIADNNFINDFLYDKDAITYHLTKIVSQHNKWLGVVKDTQIIIYGAGKVGKKIKTILEKQYNLKIKYFIVTETSFQQTITDDTPVKSLDTVKEELKNYSIIVAVSEPYNNQIINILEENNFSNYVSFRSPMELEELIYYKQCNL